VSHDPWQTVRMKMTGEMSAIVELRRCSEVGLFAVTYQGGRRRKVIRLSDGMIVEVATPEQRREAPDRLEATIGVAIDGGPATIHHYNLGDP
jgi:hypothetical protein